MSTSSTVASGGRGALHPNCHILVTMGKTNPDAATYVQQSTVLVAIDTPGVTVARSATVRSSRAAALPPR